VVMVAGGSLGARRINDATVELARSWAGTPGVCIRHVTGSRDFEAVSNLRPAPVDGGLTYQQVEFEDRMDLLLAAADVAVTRAGASTVAELTVVGIPSVLVPLPGAPGDHQTENARRLSDAGAAVVVPDSELDVERLAAEVDRLLADRAQRDRMREAARRLGRPGAADAVAALAEQYARG